MNELNTFRGAEVLEDEGYDALTVTNMGDGTIALSQVAEDGTLHHVVISEKQAAGLFPFLKGAVG